jgi:mannose-6-phosphate isomerase-like protein (cupin superfamily)
MHTTHSAAIHTRPGTGQSFWLVGDTYTLEQSGEQTRGAFSLSEARVPPGGAPLPHIRYTEDETLVLLEGELPLEAGGRTLLAPVGTMLHVP